MRSRSSSPGTVPNCNWCKDCTESDCQLATGVSPGEFGVYKCKNNMWNIVTPMMLGDRHIENLFSGQFLFDDDIVDTSLFAAQARRYGFDESEYIIALDRVPRLSGFRRCFRRRGFILQARPGRAQDGASEAGPPLPQRCWSRFPPGLVFEEKLAPRPLGDATHFRGSVATAPCGSRRR